MKDIISILFLTVFAGILLFIIPEKYRNFKAFSALLISIIIGYLSIVIYNTDNQLLTLRDLSPGSTLNLLGKNIIQGKYIVFQIDNLSKLIVLMTGLISFLILIYSVIYMKAQSIRHFYSYFLITSGCTYGAILSDNLLLFLFFWGALGLTLYKLINGCDEESSSAAKKTLILIGASDSIMIIGIAIIWSITGSLSMSVISMPTTDILAIIAFLSLICGSFTKAGAFPFHTWVPDYTENAPVSSSAYLPASLDKLLGIYFLARITNNMFVLNEWMTLLLMLAGVTSIITAVMMALMQHNYKRLLGFHAVSQVGYMILGFGMGSVIGVAAGLFHMVNNALYKSGLFLSAGCVEYRTAKNDIDDLGGLSKAMPFTFFATMIFAMSISGIPPLNGFASKWMIYQGIIDFGNGPGIANRLWILWLGLAVLGSSLTLASFVKLIGGIFLGRQRSEFKEIREVPFMMWIPLVVIAFICIFFGVFATGFIVPKLFMNVSGTFQFNGFWNSSLVSLLVLISIIFGFLIYLIFSINRFRTEDSFIGGEKIQDEANFPSTEFYKTILEFPAFSWIYKKAEEKWFDIYDLSKKFVLRISHELSAVHEGILTDYIIWVFAGLIIMLMIMI